MAQPSVDGAPSGVPRFPTDLSDKAVRKRLTPSAVTGVVALAEIWRLSSSDAVQLIGGGEISQRTWFRMKKGEWQGDLSQDCLMRMSALIGIFKGLSLLFSEPLCYSWPTLKNAGRLFNGRTPIEVMRTGGIPAMLDVRKYVDSLRGGV